MPRKGTGSKVGGPRTGTPGTAYRNRSDLNGTQPVRTAPGQPYGSRVQQERAMEAVPLPRQGAADPAGGGPPTPAPQPGGLTPLTAPTQRPHEPITAGVDVGPGPGSQVLASSPRNVGRSVLTELATETNDPFLTALAQRARR